MKIDMTYWCESCARKNNCYTIRSRPKCFVAITNTDRKTESGSEKPNNCEVKNYCDDCLYTDTCDDKAFFYACTSKATISKMEQVDKDINVRSKDEPQTDCGWGKPITVSHSEGMED